MSKDKKPKPILIFKSPLIYIEAFDRPGARRANLLVLAHIIGLLVATFSLISLLWSALISHEALLEFSLDALSFGAILLGVSMILNPLHSWASGGTKTDS